MRIGFKSELFHIAHNISQLSSGSCLIHSHAKYEILYMVEGNTICSIGGVDFEMKPHTMVFIPPNVFHSIRVLTDAPYDRYTVHFDPAILSHEHRALLLSRMPAKAGARCCMYNMEDSGILNMLRQFDDLSSSPESLHEPLVPIFLQALLARIVIKLTDQDAASPEAKSPVRLSLKNDLLNYVNAHFTEPITLDTLSARFFVSKSQLNQTFRQMTGTTVIDYIIKKRISYAQQLLLHGISAVQAGAAAGFGDYTSFFRAYKKQLGISPNQDKYEGGHSGRTIEELEHITPQTEGFNYMLKERHPEKPTPKKHD